MDAVPPPPDWFRTGAGPGALEGRARLGARWITAGYHHGAQEAPTVLGHCAAARGPLPRLDRRSPRAPTPASRAVPL